MDAQGERFQPRNTVYLSSDTPPVVGSYLVTGEDVALTPPSDAQVIRSVMAHDPSLFNEGTQDVVVMTQ